MAQVEYSVLNVNFNLVFMRQVHYNRHSESEDIKKHLQLYNDRIKFGG